MNTENLSALIEFLIGLELIADALLSILFSTAQDNWSNWGRIIRFIVALILIADGLGRMRD